QFTNNRFTVDVLRGTAEMFRPGSVAEVRLKMGSRLQLVVDSEEPAGLKLNVAGCLGVQDNQWFVRDRHIAGRVYLAGNSIRKRRQYVEVQGKPLPLPATADSAAMIHVVSEKAGDGSCDPFTPITAVGLAGGAAAAVIIPGQSSIPGETS